MRYKVFVGNIGKVFESDSLDRVLAVYHDYREQSRNGIGRAAGENVTVFKDDILRWEFVHPTRKEH